MVLEMPDLPDLVVSRISHRNGSILHDRVVRGDVFQYTSAALTLRRLRQLG